MITNDAELAIIRDQLAHCESAIDSLRKKLLPNHVRNFNLYAGPWLDLQQEFQADIDAYLSSRAPSANGVPVPSKSSDTRPLELT
jgi:hypothetical protein